tara:strand:+ start:350 stop:2131 length:1782 start_codon:yes stop_codon:yes gene_type:complete
MKDNLIAKKSSKELLTYLWNSIDLRRKYQFIALVFLASITSFFEVISIGIVIPYLGILTSPDIFLQNNIIQKFVLYTNFNKVSDIILLLTISFIVVTFVSGIMRMLLLWSQTRLSHAIGADLSRDIYNKTLHQPYEVHLNRNSSEIISSITVKVNNIVYNTILPSLRILSSILITISILITLILIEPLILGIASLGFFIIYTILIFLVRKKLSQDSITVSEEQTRLVKILQEGLGGIRDVLINGSQKTYLNEFSKADVLLRRSQANIHIIGGIPRFGIESLAIMMVVILAYFLSTSDSGFITAIPSLGALALGAQRILPLFQLVYLSWSSFRGGLDSLKDVIELIDQKIQTTDYKKNRKKINFERLISLKGVSFRYSNTTHNILDNIDLEIKKGERIGIIGETGSGKTTLIDLLMALILPNKGNFRVDSTTINATNCFGWQLNLAHVPQNIYLADNSIAENIAFGVPKNQIDDSRIRIAAQQSQIAEKIDSLDNKYDTLVGERGIKLSGGQLQRIGIARAIYKQSDVIILDEATSALDNLTEEAVMEVINNINKETTIVIVAHRLSSLKHCSRIIEIKNGKICEIGDFKNLEK